MLRLLSVGFSSSDQDRTCLDESTWDQHGCSCVCVCVWSDHLQLANVSVGTGRLIRVKSSLSRQFSTSPGAGGAGGAGVLVVGVGVHLFWAVGMLLLSPRAAEHLHQNERRPSCGSAGVINGVAGM